MSKRSDTPNSAAKLAAIYREAARMGAEGSKEGTCVWIGWAERGWTSGSMDEEWGYSHAVMNYQDLFKPEGAGHGFWGHGWADDPIFATENTVGVRECRVLALCFMAAITESP